MKEKISILLCAFAVLFFCSCADLAVDDVSAFEANLPSDFDWKVYAEINTDVASSQIIFDVHEKNKTLGDTIRNCINLLKNNELAEKIYVDYAACPKDGWDRDKKCPGIYAYNTSYNVPNSDSTSWQCIFGSISSENCWQGGWVSLKDTLSEYLESAPTAISFGPVKTMCKFIPVSTEASEVLAYLNEFKLDSLLIIEHYNYMGLYDGRPYKKCEGHHGVEKTLSLADKRGTFYDYGKYTFCFEEADQKIYVTE